MTRQILLTLFTLIIVTLQSCVPQGSSSGKRSTGGTTSNEAEETTNTPDFDDDSEIYWSTGSVTYNNSITINEDINTVIYLRGQSIHDFLTTTLDNSTVEFKDLNYCLVASYNTTGAKKMMTLKL